MMPRTACAALLLAVIAACSESTGPEATLVGHAAFGPVLVPTVSGFTPFFGDLVIRPDGTYFLGLAQQGASEGRWRVDGDALELVSASGDAGDGRRLLVRASGDSVRLTIELGGSTLGTYAFTRQASRGLLRDGTYPLVERNGRRPPTADTVRFMDRAWGVPGNTMVPWQSIVRVAYDTIAVRDGVLARRALSRSSQVGPVDMPDGVSTTSTTGAFWGRLATIGSDSLVFLPYFPGTPTASPFTDTLVVRSGGRELVAESGRNPRTVERFAR